MTLKEGRKEVCSRLDYRLWSVMGGEQWEHRLKLA